MPPQPKKRPPLDEIAKRFHLPLMKAAEDLGICQTLLKKFCRQYGIARWPYRKMKSMYMNGNEQVDAQAIEAYINQSTTPGSGGNNNSSSGHFNDGEDLGDDDEDSEIVHHQQQHYQQQQQQHYSHNSQQQQPQQHYSQNSHHHHHHQQQQQQGSYVSSPQQQQQPYPYQQQPPQPQQQSQHHSQYQYPQPYSRHLSSQHQKSHHQQQQGSGQSSYDYRVQSVHNNDERRNSSSSSSQQQRFSSNGNSNSSTGGSTTSGSFSFDQLKSSPFQSNNNNSNNNGNRDNNNNNSRVSQLPMSPKNVHLIPPVQPYHPSSNNAVVPASSSNSTPNTPTVYPASPPSSTSSALSPSNHNLSSSHHNINHNNNNNNNSSHMHDVSVGPHPTQRRVSLHTSGASQQQQESRDRIYPQPSNPLFRSYSSPSNLQFGDNFKQQHQQQGNHHQHHQHHQHQHHGSQHHASRHSLSPVHPSRKLERSKTLSFDHAPPAQLSHMVPPRSQPTSPDYSSSSVRDSSSQQARPSHIPPLQIPSNGNGPQSTLSPQQQASSHYGYNHQSIQNVGRTNSSSSTSSNNSSFANNSVPSFSFGFSSQTVTPEEHSQMYGNVEVTTVNSPVSSPRGSDEMSPVSSPVLSFEQFRLSSPTSPPASSKNTLVHHGSHQHLGSYANNSNNHNNQNNNGINNSNNGSTNSHKSKHGILSSIDSTMRNLFRSKSFTAIPRHQKPTSLENPHNNHMGTSIASKDNLLNHPPPMTRTGSGTLNTTRHPYPSSLKSIGRAYSSECISPTTHSHPNNHFMNSGVSNISADIQSQQPPKLQKLPSINQLFGPIDHLHAKRPSKELHAVESGMLDGQSGFSHHNSGTFTPIQANTRPDSPMRDSQSPNFEPSNTRPSALHNTQLQFSGGNWNNSRSQYQNHYS